MSAGSKAINIISILVSITVGIGTGIYIYRR
jgi:ABC-type phosphate transport system permease subunit